MFILAERTRSDFEIITVSVREIAETTRKDMEVRAQSCLQKGSFEAIPEHRGSFTWHSSKIITTLFLTIHDYIAES